ncbi:MAG: response regulator receiver modulated serine phosphatase, partial [Acidimicrobiia bacterium]|nr:response regulator receiver modulated serine phosphatase [Acidimicrobiia bacterium]
DDSRYLVGTWLSRSGFSVVPASTGAEAMALLDSERIDLAILDVNLPDMTGFEVCERIRASSTNPTMPVIHLSATAVGVADRSEGLLRGADAYLVEPLEPGDLIATVTALVRRSDIRRNTQYTANRLRTLNSVTADVHAASNDARLFEAVLAGAADIGGDEGLLVVRSPDGARVSHRDGAGVTTVTVTDRSVLERLLGPAATGAKVLATDDPELVSEPFVGTAFVDESGEPIGAMLVPQRVDNAVDEVVPLLGQLAMSVSLARANMHALDMEHRIALVLQQSLLPQEPPVMEGLRIAFRYVAATPEAEVCGDFYEAFELPDGTMAVAIGDVVGHSLRAATIMGEIRHGLRSYAIDGYDPQDVIIRLERLVRRFHAGMFTSAIYGVVDLVADEFRFCNAGHLPLLVVPRKTEAYFMSGHGTLVGLAFEPPPLNVLPLNVGDRLVMVTDGLVERRHESLDVGLERLKAAAESMRDTDDLGSLIDRLLIDAGPADAPPDDIAIIVVERL